MNAVDRNMLVALRKVLVQSRLDLRDAINVLDEWQDMDRTMTPGHTDKIFNNYGSGRSDR